MPSFPTLTMLLPHLPLYSYQRTVSSLQRSRGQLAAGAQKRLFNHLLHTESLATAVFHCSASRECLESTEDFCSTVALLRSRKQVLEQLCRCLFSLGLKEEKKTKKSKSQVFFPCLYKGLQRRVHTFSFKIKLCISISVVHITYISF